MDDVTYTINDYVWAEELQAGLDDYVMTLFDGIDEIEPPDNLTNELFCGCNVCEYRETLAYLLPRIIEGLVEGRLVVERDGRAFKITEL